ncbi:MAG: hypothetical protein ACRCTZ_07875 [Sarcina sp.]
MRKEMELIQGIRDTNESYDGLFISSEELEVIEESSMVETCEYVGLKDGHEGEDTYHVTLIDDSEVKSLYVVK